MSRLRYVNPPSGLLRAIEQEPDGSELVVGSGYFLRRLPDAPTYEVWLTPRRCHFSVNIAELTDEAQHIIQTTLPRFQNVLAPNGRKTIATEPWRWRDLMADTPFVWNAEDTTEPVHSFCQHGNWVIFAGPYAFHYCTPFQPPVWGPLLDIDITLMDTLLKIGYCCNHRRYLQPGDFSSFVVECHSTVQITEAARRLVHAHVNERIKAAAEQAIKKKLRSYS